MSGPKDAPVDIEFTSEPSLGLKAIRVDADVAEALVKAMQKLGFEAEKVATEMNDLWRIWITKLPEWDADATVQL
jgi:hypothetical protein